MSLVTPECKLTGFLASSRFLVKLASKVPFSSATFMKMRPASYRWPVIQQTWKYCAREGARRARSGTVEKSSRTVVGGGPPTNDANVPGLAFCLIKIFSEV